MTKMTAGQIIGPRRLEFVEVPVPEIGEGQMLIKLEAGSICGSDLPFFLCDTSHPFLAGGAAPLPPMLSLHELVGTVARSRSSRFGEGERVLALPIARHAGLAEYFVSQTDFAVPLPAGAAERLVVSQPLGTVVHACLKLPNLLGQTAAVVGQGPIGLLFTALLRRMGVAQLLAIDPLPERLRVSTAMGATHVSGAGAGDAARALGELTGGRGADLVVEAVGQAETLNSAARLMRRNGTLVAFGVPHRYSYDFDFHDFFFNEGRLITSLGPDVQHDFSLAVEMIASGAIDVAPLVTHVLPFERAQDGFSLFADRAEGAIKVVLTAGG